MNIKIFHGLPDHASGQPNGSRRSFLRGVGGATIVAAMPWWAMRDALAVPTCSSLTNLSGDIEYGKPPKLTNRIPMEIGGKRYYRNEVNAWWAEQCRPLPCFHGVCWRGYAERVLKNVPVRINNSVHYVIVHMWKGLCQKFLGNPAFPGGMGAEVGVYLVQPSSWAANRPFSKTLWAALGADATIVRAAEDLPNPHKWYPAYEWDKDLNIRFRLLDPVNKAVVFETRPKSGYWCTEWMEKEAYWAWERCRGESVNATHLTLEYRINDYHGAWQYRKDANRDDFWCKAGKGYKGDIGPLT